MRSLWKFGCVALACAVAAACGGTTISLGSNDYALQSNADGSATGNGQTCSWDKLPSQGALKVGDTFKSFDSCNNCKCTATGVACTQLACGGDGGAGGTCTYNGKTYSEGASFPSSDGCNSCGCAKDGEVTCTLMACAPAGCTYGGKTYSEGASFPSTDGCNTCSCTSSGVGCTEKACASTCNYNGKTYNEGDSFPSTDGCNSCGCSKGGVVCTAKACAP